MMPGSLRVGGIGAAAVVELDGPRQDDVRAPLLAAWSRCLEAPAAARDAGTLRLRLGRPGESAGGGLARDSSDLASDDLATLMSTATQAITYALIKAQAGRLLMLHAGAVCHPQTGRTLVFVAEGGTGKTTLARTLGRHYGYLTDETVGIEADGRVLPYPKPLSLRPASGGWPKDETSPDALGLLPAHPEPVVARVVVLARDPAATAPRITELPLLDAIQTITPQSSSLYALPKGLHRCADLIGATGPVLQVTYAEAESLLPLVAELIGTP